MLTIAVALALAAAPAPPPPAKPAAKARSILVMDLAASAGVADAQTLATITNTLAVNVQKRPGLNVLTGQDVKRMAQVEADKQVLGCDAASASCIAEIAGAMGADLVLYGDVGKLSDLYVVNLNLFDAGQAKAVGRQSVQVKTFDESFIAQLDIAVRTLLSPVTGESSSVTLAPTSGAAVPTIDLEALKSSGLKSINMAAEKALETALDAQDDKAAPPERKRDAWCALAQVQGANPYLEAAQKACGEWQKYVVANVDLEKNMSADFDTLAGFLELKRKTKEQKLEAIDSFLKSYDRLGDRPMVQKVKSARAQLVATGSAVLAAPSTSAAETPAVPATTTATEAPPPSDDGPHFFRAGFYGFNFEMIPYFGPEVRLEANTSTFTAPVVGAGAHVAWAFAEAGGDARLHLVSNAAAEPFRYGFYAGVRGIYASLGSVEVFNPSAGLDTTLSSKGSGGETVWGPYIANTIGAGFLDLRIFYRAEFVGAASTATLSHHVGLVLTVDLTPAIIDLFR